MDIGKIGVYAVLESMTVNETLEFARTIEKRGYKALGGGWDTPQPPTRVDARRDELG